MPQDTQSTKGEEENQLSLVKTVFNTISVEDKIAIFDLAFTGKKENISLSYGLLNQNRRKTE